MKERDIWKERNGEKDKERGERGKDKVILKWKKESERKRKKEEERERKRKRHK